MFDQLAMAVRDSVTLSIVQCGLPHEGEDKNVYLGRGMLLTFVVLILFQFSTLSSSSSSHRIGTSPRTYSTPDVDDEEEEEEEDADSFIVPRKAPQPPPMRPNRRPKSTPPHCDSEADDIGRRQKR